MFGDRAAQTERVMDAIFPEQAMVLFHRVSLEMSFADNFLANRALANRTVPNRARSSPPVREIIEVEDDDDVMVDGSQPNVATGE